MNYLIRPMKYTDIEYVYKIESQVFPNPWPKSFFKNDLQKSNVIALVICNDDAIIGYGLADCITEELHITNIAIDINHQHQGAGTKLLAEMEKFGLERGCIKAYLEVRVTNKYAINFYKKFGYQIMYIRKNYYLDGADAYVMAKVIQEVL